MSHMCYLGQKHTHALTMFLTLLIALLYAVQTTLALPPTSNHPSVDTNHVGWTGGACSAVERTCKVGRVCSDAKFLSRAIDAFSLCEPSSDSCLCMPINGTKVHFSACTFLGDCTKYERCFRYSSDGTSTRNVRSLCLTCSVDIRMFKAQGVSITPVHRDTSTCRIAKRQTNRKVSGGSGGSSSGGSGSGGNSGTNNGNGSGSGIGGGSGSGSGSGSSDSSGSSGSSGSGIDSGSTPNNPSRTGFPRPSPVRSSNPDDEAGASDEPESDESAEGSVCIAVRHLNHLPSEALVYASHRRAAVLCDSHGSCATPGHMVVHAGTPMMMMTYCAKQTALIPNMRCKRRSMLVNSPRMSANVRILSQTPNLEFSAHAARFQARMEQVALTVIIRLGL